MKPVDRNSPRGRIRALLTILMAGVALLVAGPATADPPPELVHFTGRLTGLGGAPITGSRTAFFSIWVGGDEATANSGTEVYRESTVVSPDSDGLFEHQIGSGVVQAGELDPADFNSASPVFVQVNVDSFSAGTTLLPRARFTSVGYAFVAAYAPKAGTPQVTSVTDLTGGVTVVGDLLEIEGAGLGSAAVMVGGLPAKIKTQSGSSIVCQVPAGVPMGLNSVSVVEQATGGPANVAAYVDVHRLLVGVNADGSGSDSIFVIDMATQALVTQINPSPDIPDDEGPVQMAFAHDGALLLVASNNSSDDVMAIDLTLPTPIVVDTLNVSGTTRGVAASPDGKTIIASVTSDSSMRAVRLGQTAPPYGSTLIGDTGVSIDDVPSGFQPRASAFVGNGLLVVLGTGTNQMLAIRRAPDAANINDEFFVRDFLNASVRLQNPVDVGITPLSLTVSPDQSRIFVTTQAPTNNIELYLLGPDGFSSRQASALGGAGALQTAIAPSGNVLLTADETEDLLHAFHVAGAGIATAGDMEGPNSAQDDEGGGSSVDEDEDFQIVAVDSVEGAWAAIGTNESNVRLYRLNGTAMELRTVVSLSSSTRQMVALQFQP